PSSSPARSSGSTSPAPARRSYGTQAERSAARTEQSMRRRSRRGFRSRPAIEKLVDAREYAAQDIDLFPLQARPREQPPQPRQQPLRLTRVEEAHRNQRALGVGEQLLDFVKRGRRERGSGPHRFAACGEEQLVGRDLNRRGATERGLSRLVGNGRHDL